MQYRKKYDELIKALRKRYSKILDDVVSDLQKNGKAVDIRKLEAQLNKQFEQIERDIKRDVGTSLSQAYEDGLAENYLGMYKGMTLSEAEKLVKEQLYHFNVGTEDNPKHVTSVESIQRLREIAEQKLQDKGMTIEQARKIIAGQSTRDPQALHLMADTFEDILRATHNTHDGIKKVVREFVKEIAQADAMAGIGGSYKEQAEELVKRLTEAGFSKTIEEQGFVGIVDRAGKEWNVETYSEMVIKSKTNDAYMEGIRTGSKDLGMDLAIISDHGAEDECSMWENVVISMNGLTNGYPTYDEAKGTNEVFHPNCQHTVHIIRDESMLSDYEQELLQSQMDNLGDYQERIKKK